MAERQYWIGSNGPFYYDDEEEQVPAAEATDDPLDSPADSTLKHTIRTEGQILVGTAPSNAKHVLRMEDLDAELQQAAVADIDSPNLLAYSATKVGALLIAYKVNANANEYTIYAWDTVLGSGPNSPYSVIGNGGYWLAVGGKYSNTPVHVPPGVAIYIGTLAYFIYQNNRLELFVNGTLQATWP